MVKRKKSLLILTLILAFTTFLAGCGGSSGGSSGNKESTKQETNTPDSTSKESSSGGGSEGKEQVFRMNLSTEPPTLDPGVSQDVTSFVVLSSIYEGLTRADAQGKPLKGIAEDWKISSDGKKYTFTLRKDAKWSNGDPVTAHDFEFAWKRVLDPNMQPAPPYAYQMYYLKNAQEYNTKKITDPNQVGVKATDDYTLEVELNNPTNYFLSLLSFQTYFPVHKSAKDNKKWAAEANTIITNGPFKVAEWKHQSNIVLEKNENYYAKDEVKFTKVTMAMVKDAATEFNMYQSNQLDYSGAPTGEVPTDQIPVLKKTKKDELVISPLAGTYYYLFNNKVEPFDNVNIRKAFAMAIDRKQIVEKVTLGEQIPAYGLVSKGIVGVNDEFRNEVPSEGYFKEDLAEAKALLEKGIQEKGYKTLPQITLIHNTGAGHKKVAQAIADMWSKAFGIQVKIEQQEWAVFLKNRTAGNYQVARGGWNTDYNDAMSFIDMFQTGAGNNDIFFSNQEYDKLIQEAYKSTDQKFRVDSMAKAEKILIQDNQAIAPLYYYTSVKLIKPNLKNVYTDYQGIIQFTRGYFE